jgi:hypothetical protein
VSRLISHEEIDSERQSDKITEKSPQIEKKDRSHEDARRGLDSSPPQDGRKGSQELIEKERDAKKEARIEGQFQKGKEGFGNGIGDQVHPQRSPNDVAEQGF